MRIRKRFLSLSAALPPPPSSLPPPSSSDHTTQIPPLPPPIFKPLESENKNLESIKTLETDYRKDGILVAEAKNRDLVMKGWLQGDRLVPTKKKRGSNGKRLDNVAMKDNEMSDGAMNQKNKNKKNEKIREGVIMEGSRCSRVNGRGWRCSQGTLVGYSLCEHHLGKGRVRNGTKERKDKKIESLSVDNHDEVEDDIGDYDDEDWDVESVSSVVGLKVFGKKTKVGVVKARSLSSLLSEISS